MSNFRKIERLTIYRVVCLEGKGTSDNLYREVSRYFLEDGTPLFIWDVAGEFTFPTNSQRLDKKPT